MANSRDVVLALSVTPVRLAELTRSVALADLRRPPGTDEWSVNDVLAHLRSCADVWGGCIERLLAEDAPTLRAVNPRTHQTQTDYVDLDFRRSFDAFVEQRRALLAVLESLSPQAWARTATVTGAGRPLERTVLDYADRLERHERAHVKQVARTVEVVRGDG